MSQPRSKLTRKSEEGATTRYGCSQRLSRIDPVNPEDVSEQTREICDEYLKVTGHPSIPIVWLVWARIPMLMWGKWLCLKATIMESTLPRSLINSISMIVHKCVGCKSGVFINAYDLRAQGRTSEEIQSILDLDKRVVSERDYEILQYAIKSTREAYRITDNEFDKLRRLGFSNMQLLEITEAIASSLYQANLENSLAIGLTEWQVQAGIGLRF